MARGRSPREAHWCEEFLGVRTRFQRAADYRFFTGWVKEMSPSHVIVRAQLEPAFANGQTFQFDVYGTTQVASFPARLDSQIAFLGAPSHYAKAPSPAADQGVEFEFQILGPVSYRPGTEEARFLTTHSRVEIDGESGVFEGTVLDVSLSGIGVQLAQPLHPGAAERLRIESDFGPISCEAEVRYCRPIANSTNYHVGFIVRSIERVDRARWSKLRA